MRRGLVTVTCVLALCGTSARAGWQQSVAPAFALPDERGEATALEALRGRVVLVDVWASWCAPCKVAFPRYDAFFREYRDRGFTVLAVNVDESRANADRFLRAQPHAMTVVFDPRGTVPTRFKLSGMPTSYLIDRRGRIRYTHEGFKDRDVAEYRKWIETLLAEEP